MSLYHCSRRELDETPGTFIHMSSRLTRHHPSTVRELRIDAKMNFQPGKDIELLEQMLAVVPSFPSLWPLCQINESSRAYGNLGWGGRGGRVWDKEAETSKVVWF